MRGTVRGGGSWAWALHRGDARVEDLLEARSALGDCESGAVDAPLVKAGVDVREGGAEAVGVRVVRIDKVVQLIGVNVERVVFSVDKALDGGRVAVAAQRLDRAVCGRKELVATVAVVEVEPKGV